MRELSKRLLEWHQARSSYALVTVVGVTGSTPRPVGSVMAVHRDGTVIGGLSGGCVEGAVHELCLDALNSGEPRRETFGYAEDDEFAVGLACGGAIEVFVQPVTPAGYPVIEAVLRTPEPVALVRDLGTAAMTALTPDHAVGAPLTPSALAEARAMLAAADTGPRATGCEPEDATIFVESFAPPARLIVFGAVDVAAALTRIGRFLGYHVTVCDARPVFATPDRAPDADEIVVDWPHRYLERTATDARTVVCVLTHDPKFDIPVLTAALRMPLAYVGAMGSRRADADRRARLRDAGLTDAELARLRSPIGLDLGGRSPAETALAIAAEFVAARHGGSTHPLHTSTHPLHAPLPAPN